MAGMIDRAEVVREQTRKAYCHPLAKVEQQLLGTGNATQPTKQPTPPVQPDAHQTQPLQAPQPVLSGWEEAE